MISTKHLSTKADFEAALEQALNMRSAAKFNVIKMQHRQNNLYNYKKYDDALYGELFLMEYSKEAIQKPMDEKLRKSFISTVKQIELKIPKLQEKAKKRGVQKFLLYAMKQAVYEAQVRMLDEYVEELKRKLEVTT